MDPLELARAAMTDVERAEYERISETLHRQYLPITMRIYAVMGAGLVLSGVGFGVSVATSGPRAPWVVLWAVVFSVALFGGLFAAALTDTLTRKRMRLRRAELLAAAAARIPDPRARGRESDDRDSGVNWSKYPVTGVYDPQTYYERGGRSTARAMQAWGDIDYETYRSNIE